jgi:hypothetical protein
MPDPDDQKLGCRLKRQTGDQLQASDLVRASLSAPPNREFSSNQPENLSPLKPRTLQQSEIPRSVDEYQLRQYLNNLECGTSTGFATENILALSLAPYIQ